MTETTEKQNAGRVPGNGARAGLNPENVLALVQALRVDGGLRAAFLGMLGGDAAGRGVAGSNPADALFHGNSTATLAGAGVGAAQPGVTGLDVAKNSHPQSQQSPQASSVLAALAQFEADKPGYFGANPVRGQLRDYLNANCAHLSQEEITAILAMASGLESQAVENFKSQSELDKTILNSNNTAKSKLSTEAARAAASGVYSKPPFTRQQIAAMSMDEYRKNEKEIFDQYKKGLIK